MEKYLFKRIFNISTVSGKPGPPGLQGRSCENKSSKRALIQKVLEGLPIQSTAKPRLSLCCNQAGRSLGRAELFSPEMQCYFMLCPHGPRTTVGVTSGEPLILETESQRGEVTCARSCRELEAEWVQSPDLWFLWQLHTSCDDRVPHQQVPRGLSPSVPRPSSIPMPHAFHTSR